MEVLSIFLRRRALASRILLGLGAAILAAGPLAAAEAPHQFDLVCKGEAFSREFGPKPVNWPTHLRVDLDAMRYCDGVCDSVLTIQQIGATEIIFANGSDEDGGLTYRVDRVTGVLTEVMLIHGVRTLYHATCEPAPFSGWPEPPKTKF